MAENQDWERNLITKLATAARAEQRRARRWGIFFKLLTFAYITLVVMLAVDWRGKAEGVGGKKHTAMVEINGIISSDKKGALAGIIQKRGASLASLKAAAPG